MEREYDVIVAGGGIAGSIAAVSAGREGAKVLLVEKNAYPGGMLVAAGVGPMMSFHAGDKQVVRGLPGELIDRLTQKGLSPGHVPDPIGFTDSITPFDAEGLKNELEIMLLESKVDLLYNTMLYGAEVESGKIRRIRCACKGGGFSLSGRVYIDATGDADLSVLAGVKFSKGREKDGRSQPMTLNLKLGNVDTCAIKDYMRENPDEFPATRGGADMIDKAPRLAAAGFKSIVKKAYESGRISFNRGDLLMFETNNPGELILNSTRVQGFDATDPWSMSMAEVEGRVQVRELIRLLKDEVPGFKEAVVLYSGPCIGVRSSRQIVGMYTLTKEDILSCRKFSDVIAHSGYPVDVHNPDGGGIITYELRKGGFYGIPYGCLVNCAIHNLITVGRCISATFEAQAAIRTTPTAGAVGQAGGSAAYLALSRAGKVSEINVQELQELLAGRGVFLSL